jgi:hypothetical protein
MSFNIILIFVQPSFLFFVRLFSYEKGKNSKNFPFSIIALDQQAVDKKCETLHLEWCFEQKLLRSFLALETIFPTLTLTVFRQFIY